jgi:hypothetical protein
VYLRDYETFEDVAAHLPASSTRLAIIGGSFPRSAISSGAARGRARLPKRPHDDVARAAERVHSNKEICSNARGLVSKRCNLKGRTVDG